MLRSSKGGFAALYMALRHGYGYAVVGSPQVFLGQYLTKRVRRQDVAAFIAGGTSDQDIAFLDQLLIDAARTAKTHPEIYIHLGRGEYHYKYHVQPFTAELDRLGVPYELDLGDYDQHSDVAKYFPPYLVKTLERITATQARKWNLRRLLHRLVYW